MARTRQPLAFLDTHIVVWLYDALENRFTKKAKECINKSVLVISPLVLLELQYLFEIKKINEKPDAIIASLSHTIGLEVAESFYNDVIRVAVAFDWTRDPFDRLLTAEAQINGAWFITADTKIKKHFKRAIW